MVLQCFSSLEKNFRLNGEVFTPFKINLPCFEKNSRMVLDRNLYNVIGNLSYIRESFNITGYLAKNSSQKSYHFVD